MEKNIPTSPTRTLHLPIYTISEGTDWFRQTSYMSKTPLKTFTLNLCTPFWLYHTMPKYKDIFSVYVVIQSTILTNCDWYISSNRHIAMYVKKTVSQLKCFWCIWVSVPEYCTFVSIILQSSFVTVRLLYCRPFYLLLGVQFFLFVCLCLLET